MYANLVVWLAVTAWVGVSGHVDHLPHADQAEKMKQKWGLESVIHDLDHIKEDVQSIMELNKIGEISRTEMVFYLIRMHDFDDNGGLDGIELRSAFQHSMEHLSVTDPKPMDIEDLIDDVLKYDNNNDGIVDYAEFRVNT